FSVQERSACDTVANVSAIWWLKDSSAGTSGPIVDAAMLPSLPAMAFARQRDPEVVRAGLSAWLGEPVGDFTRPTSGGLSSETYMFESSRGPLVARLAPQGDGLFPVYDLGLQARVMEALAAHAVVPVPPVVAYVDDPQWLGSPFLVMERVAGRIPTDNPPF